MLCDDLGVESWRGGGSEGGDICITLANLNSCMVETKTALAKVIFSIKKSLNKQTNSCWNFPGD